jgi:hypothetical protein
MKRPAELLFACCVATILGGAGPAVTAAAEISLVTQDLVNVSASDLVTTALWSRLSDSYTLRVVLDEARMTEKRRAMAAARAAERAAATPGTAGPITSITAAEMQRLGIVNVAEALAMLVPQSIENYMPQMTGDPRVAGGVPAPDGTAMTRGDRTSFFIGETIANLRGMDPAFACRTLTLVDGRRAVAGQPLPPSPPPARVKQPYPSVNKDGRVEVWLLKADGTQILPVAYSCVPASRGVDVGIEYQFSVADSTQAVAAAVRIDDEFYIDKLQPLASMPAVLQ